jgi:hypothetical protein
MKFQPPSHGELLRRIFDLMILRTLFGDRDPDIRPEHFMKPETVYVRQAGFRFQTGDRKNDEQ